jgi:Ni/Co efflux regulator RcnB
MKLFAPHLTRCAAVSLSLALACGVALAGKPEWAGQGKGNNKGASAEQQQPQSSGTSVEIRIGAYFEDHQRTEVQTYYGKQSAAGHCPPGLAKKNNGCLPPGQAKKWAMGQALPRDVVFYPVPNAVVVKIGLPPKGYKYVRVASDVLLIAIGSMIVIDAIEDLMRP